MKAFSWVLIGFILISIFFLSGCSEGDEIIIGGGTGANTSIINPFNQSLNTTDSPAFSGLTVNGRLDISNGYIFGSYNDYGAIYELDIEPTALGWTYWADNAVRNEVDITPSSIFLSHPFDEGNYFYVGNDSFVYKGGNVCTDTNGLCSLPANLQVTTLNVTGKTQLQGDTIFDNNGMIYNYTTNILNGTFNLSMQGETPIMAVPGGDHYISAQETDMWCTASASCYVPFEGTSIASGTMNRVAGGVNHQGVAAITASTTATSGYALKLQDNGILIGGGEKMSSFIRPLTMSNVNGTRIYVGLEDSGSATAPVDGVYFNITQNATGTFFVRLEWRSNSVTTNSSTITYSLANATWIHTVVLMNTNTLATGYIYNEAGTELYSTFLGGAAFAAGRETGAGIVGFTVGSTSASGECDVDKLKYELYRRLNR